MSDKYSFYQEGERLTFRVERRSYPSLFGFPPSVGARFDTIGRRVERNLITICLCGFVLLLRTIHI